ncbi:hypothetical protein ABPG77_005508 [Micractinium sp. CCAP 211/92]
MAAAGWTAFRISGVISEVNAVEWTSWGLVNSKGTLRYPGFPPVAYVQMEASRGSAVLNASPGGALCSGETWPQQPKIQTNVPNLRRYGVNSDFVIAPSRPVNQSWFSDRSPVITPQQSSAIVAALQQLGNSSSPLYQWTQRLQAALPWLNSSGIGLVPDQSDITEEMNIAYSWHEGIADYVRPCLAWLQANGSSDLRYLSSRLAVYRLAQLTMDRVYPAIAAPATAPSAPTALSSPPIAAAAPTALSSPTATPSATQTVAPAPSSPLPATACPTTTAAAPPSAQKSTATSRQIPQTTTSQAAAPPQGTPSAPCFSHVHSIVGSE